MGDEADDIITSFGLSEQEMKSYETVRDKAKFNVGIQDENEPVESFITDLHCLAKYCEFGVLKDQLIRDRIVVGLRNKKLSEKLQLGPDLTLAKAMAQARQSEEIKKQQNIIHGKNRPEVGA
ncbi:Transposon Tf2-6 poly [Paramuricea clavata]|uniref:Transposon Tf2-6 poly n=1 Tax=Paramuricea clavata TaxID=317549 RepID=A0A6S7I7X0_PARCT|nr:Transposon Tf2-6 poly [Paramuricea clavata]